MFKPFQTFQIVQIFIKGTYGSSTIKEMVMNITRKKQISQISAKFFN